MEKKDTDGLDPQLAAKYLSIYTGEANWKEHLLTLWEQIKHNSDLMKKSIACSVLLPTFDKHALQDPPQNLLFYCRKWQQFNDQDWWELFKLRLERDAEIERYRNRALSLGIVHPIEYSPVTRQAFNWLFDAADKAGAVTAENKADITHRFQNLILAYGGNVICYVFQKEAHKLKKVLNWRTGYFFEHIIFEVFNIDQVLKIKKAELDKTNPKLVKRVRTDNN